MDDGEKVKVKVDSKKKVWFIFYVQQVNFVRMRRITSNTLFTKDGRWIKLTKESSCKKEH